MGRSRSTARLLAADVDPGGIRHRSTRAVGDQRSCARSDARVRGGSRQSASCSHLGGARRGSRRPASRSRIRGRRVRLHLRWGRRSGDAVGAVDSTRLPAWSRSRSRTRRDRSHSGQGHRLRPVARSTSSAGGCAPGLASREETPTEERALERPVTVHTAAPESARLAGGIQAGDRFAVGSESAAVEIGVDPAE